MPETIPFISLRLWHQHCEPDQVTELLRLLRKHPGACDEIWFATEYGFPPVDVHRKSAEAMVKAAEQVRRAGLVASLQVSNTLGHGDVATHDYDGITWQRMVGHDGTPARNCNCPSDPGFLAYLDEVMRLYAACKPASVWIDDDLRTWGHGVAYGCFCERCLREFSATHKRKWTRETLVAAFGRPNGIPLRRAWVAFGQESLARVARTVGRAFCDVAPACRISLQHANSELVAYGGPDWTRVLGEMKKVSGRAPGSRPGGGFYTDHAPREMLTKAYDIARQIERLPAYVTDVRPEIENFVHTAMGKTPHGTVLESALDLAVGCNGLSYCTLMIPHEPLSWHETMLERIADWRPFMQDYVRRVEGTRMGGLEIVAGRHAIERPAQPGKSAMAWAEAQSFSPLVWMTTLGLPLCPQQTGAAGAALCAAAVDGLHDDEIELLLGRGLLLDGNAAMRLQERGFGDKLGVRVARYETADAFEHFTDDPLNGRNAGHVWRAVFFGNSDSMYRLEPLHAGTRTLGEYRTPKGAARGIASLIGKTALGGRFAIFGYSGWEPTVSGARRTQLLAAADWVSRNRLPAIVDTTSQVVVIPRVDGGGRLRAVTLLNANIDHTPALSLRIRKPVGSRVSWIRPEQRNARLNAENDGKDSRVRVPPMAPWSIGYVLCGNTGGD